MATPASAKNLVRHGIAASRPPGRRRRRRRGHVGGRARRAGRAAGRCAGHGVAAPDAAISSSTSGPILVMSPAPMVSTRSPGAASAATTAGTSAKSGDVPRRAARHRVRDEPAGHPRLGVLAGRVHVEHHGLVREPEGGAELGREDPGPAEQVRLEDRDDPPAAGRDVAGRAQVGGELGRVVRVGVEDPDTAGLALGLEPPRGAAVSWPGPPRPAPARSRARRRRRRRRPRSARCGGPARAAEDQDRFSRTDPGGSRPSAAPPRPSRRRVPRALGSARTRNDVSIPLVVTPEIR